VEQQQQQQVVIELQFDNGGSCEVALDLMTSLRLANELTSWLTSGSVSVFFFEERSYCCYLTIFLFYWCLHSGSGRLVTCLIVTTSNLILHILYILQDKMIYCIILHTVIKFMIFYYLF